MEHPIEQLGGPSAVARMCGISAPSVCDWRKNGIPPKRCFRIEQLNSVGLKRWDLRPGDWWEHWPELIGMSGAPAIPVTSAAAAGTEAQTAQKVAA
jgi:DNA-binding transcriptional regulator YdaS (Cro superfamily)